VADACGINKNTAYGWVNKQAKGVEMENKPRGGRRHGKVTDAMVDDMLEMISADASITLKELAKKVSDKHGIEPPLSTTAIDNHLDGKSFSVKRVHAQSENANTVANKTKRRLYVEAVMAALGAEKHIVYIDESNVNLFCTRTIGRSKVGQRATITLPGSKGPNVHMLAGLTQQGLVNFTRRRGAYHHGDANEWMKELLDELFKQGFSGEGVALVIDNAPCHSRVEQIKEQAEYSKVDIIRLAPYSPALNPIEMAWSAIKARIKASIAEGLREPQPQGLTKTEHRLRVVEKCIDDARQVVTPAMAQAFCNRVQRHHAACLREEDISVGI
jgi:transposase